MKKSIITLLIVAAAVLIFKQLQQRSDNAPLTEETSMIEREAVPASAINDAATETISLITSAAENAEVFIIEPQPDSVITSPLTVKFGIANMVIAPAGDDQSNSGHHHLLIDLAELPDMSQPLPANENIIHFGKGQTETTLELTPGQHTLQLLLGNYLHVPHSEPVISEEISVIVE